ncbi:MAG: GNAT family N-acetyltransferase [Deltaproteobacteria bacterium]|nr:GNAT family N-acetyltransferase [Deltaproteobacteria bacterium]
MKVVDLTPEYEELYMLCLEDWSDEAREGQDLRAHWYARVKDHGLRVKLALDERGNPGGMIQYLPIERSFAEGRDLYLILCIWVHGHPQGRGNFQGKGMGTALLQAAEDDVRALGAKGIAAWGVVLPVWMKASWFRKHGYRKADRVGMAALVWKPFTEDAEPPRLMRPGKKPGRSASGVTVTAFNQGWCMAQNIACERAHRACTHLGDEVTFRRIDTNDPDVRREWGQADALFVEDREIWTGPPPSEEKLRRAIGRAVTRAQRRVHSRWW